MKPFSCYSLNLEAPHPIGSLTINTGHGYWSISMELA